jgi:Asp-tRNA(Asn)/Glu-tRNA(Gln) amidotransferase A subunit family amidase
MECGTVRAWSQTARVNPMIHRVVGLRVDVPEGTDLGQAGNAYAATRTAGFGDEAKRRILLGTYALSAE